LKNWIRES